MSFRRAQALAGFFLFMDIRQHRFAPGKWAEMAPKTWGPHWWRASEYRRLV